ncbi:MAG TPA: hypothetical protein VM305_06260 [Candidatus Limnocylindrales bacterium]|nr:hypothetical protein [Candidatus Limnocylindrales bacterium]
MSDPNRDEERREALPEHEYRPQRGVGAGVSGAGTSEQGDMGDEQEGGRQPGDELTGEGEPAADI